MVPSLAPEGGMLVRMVSWGMVGMAGVVSGVIPIMHVLIHVHLMLISTHCCGCIYGYIWRSLTYYYCGTYVYIDCRPHPCGRGTCSDEVGGYTCTCPAGCTFSGGVTCEEGILYIPHCII